MKKKILSLLTAFAMVFGILVAPFTTASAADANSKTPRTGEDTIGTFTADDISVDTKPTSTKLYVHKLQSSSFNVGPDGKKHDGSKLSDEQVTALGKTPKPINGVKFKYYKIDDAAKFAEMVKNPGSYKTEDKMTGYTGTEVKTQTVGTDKGVIADANGQVLDLPEGNYWFIETGYEKDTTDPDAPDNISSYIAVPFGITLPLTNVSKIKVGETTYEPGTVWLKNVHTYPKNVTGNNPEPDKTVEDLVNKHATHNVGDTVFWHLNATIPANFKDYKKLKFKDSLDDSITYVGNIKVRYGNGNETEFKKLANELTVNDDYIVKTFSDKEYTTETTNVAEVKSFTVELTKAGIEKIANNLGTITNPKISVEFESKLNDNAKVETGNPNEYTLVWNNKSTDEKDDEEKPSDKPKVYTGERKFVKTDSADRTVLAQATFVVKNDKKTETPYLKKDENGNVSWVAEIKDATPFTTNDNGEIIVGKLQFTYAVVGKPQDIDEVTLDKETQLNDYKLVETQAPKDYAKLEDPIPFEITPDSYKSGAVKIDQGKALDAKTDGTHTEIKNTKLTIPQTGGIGSVIFIVAGLAIMAGAFVAYRKSQAVEA